MTALGLLVIAGARLVIFADVFPPPWPDEVHFLVLSAPWSSGFTFDARGTLNPHGIFWIPAGFTIFNASVGTALGRTDLWTGRFGANLCMVSAGIGMVFVYRSALADRSTARAALFSLTWALAAPCLLAANVARPEALVLALSLWALWAALRGDALAAVGFALIACCVHPLLALPCLVAAWMSLWPLRRYQLTKLNVTVVVVGLCLLLTEGYFFTSHTQDYLADWRYQLARKSGRGVSLAAVVVLTALAASALGSAYVRQTRPTSRLIRPLLLATTALGFFAVQAYGQEMWYASFSATGVAIAILAMCRSVAAATDGGNFSGARAALLRTAPPLAMAAAALFGWCVAIQKGRVQGISTDLNYLRDQERDQREVEQMVSDAVDELQGPLVISSSIASSLLPRLQAHELFTTNARSDYSTASFRTALYVSGARSRDSVLDALAGHTCLSSHREASSRGLYEVTIAQLAPPLPGEERRPYQPCLSR